MSVPILEEVGDFWNDGLKWETVTAGSGAVLRVDSIFLSPNNI